MPTTPVASVAYRTCRDQFLLLVRWPDSMAALEQIGGALRSHGYEKERDIPGGYLYGRGSKAGRILGGAFGGCQEFKVTFERDGDLVLLSVKGTASVISTGAIGIYTMRNELALLGHLITHRFAPCPSPEDVAQEDLGRFGAIMTGPQAGRGKEYAMVIIIALIIMIVLGALAFIAR